MNARSPHLFWLLLPVAALIIVDEWLKAWALKRLPSEGSLVDPGVVALAIHKNWGIAFDIPFKLEIVILISIVIGVALLHLAYTHTHTHPPISFSALMIVFGALGNIYDRLMYGFTVDYLILFGRSAINLSDVVIVAGVVMLLVFSRKQRKFDKASESS